MDHKPSNPDTNSWVDDRMANLDPAPDWNPDAARALERLTQRQPSVNAQWMRLGMTTTILAATVLVLVMLPWRRLWTPQASATPKVVTTFAAQMGTAPQRPSLKQLVETAPPQAPAAPTRSSGKVLQDSANGDAPDNGKEISQYPEEIAKAREIAESSPSGLVAPVTAQAAPADVTAPLLIHSVLPEYSPEAKQAKIQGTIELMITVKVDGTVQFENFRKTLGYGLDEKAREAVEQWLFTPGKKNGVPVATMTTVSMNFSLK